MVVARHARNENWLVRDWEYEVWWWRYGNGYDGWGMGGSDWRSNGSVYVFMASNAVARVITRDIRDSDGTKAGVLDPDVACGVWWCLDSVITARMGELSRREPKYIGIHNSVQAFGAEGFPWVLTLACGSEWEPSSEYLTIERWSVFHTALRQIRLLLNLKPS